MFPRIADKLRRLEVKSAQRILRRTARSTNGAQDESLERLIPAWLELVAASTNRGAKDVVAAGRAMISSQLPAEDWTWLPAFSERPKPVMSTWTFQNEVMEWDIAEGDLVLDIGSGGWPFKRANHLADKFPEGTTHRFESMVQDDRPFFEVDIEHLPFEDKSYDFVFCSHVIEHLDNPGGAMRELMRVAKRGYIEVPTRLSDVMFNFTRLQNHHRWHSVLQGNTLLLTEWNERERRELGNQFFDALHSKYANPFQDFFERNRDLFFTSYHWSGSIEFLVIDKDGGLFDSSRPFGGAASGPMSST